MDPANHRRHAVQWRGVTREWFSMPYDTEHRQRLIEWQLGASAGSRPEQDFPDLGIELKTIPIDPQGKPLETTFVCVAPLIGISGQRWEESNVRNKLSRVLWIPVEGSRTIPVARAEIALAINQWITQRETLRQTY